MKKKDTQTVPMFPKMDPMLHDKSIREQRQDDFDAQMKEKLAREAGEREGHVYQCENCHDIGSCMYCERGKQVVIERTRDRYDGKH